MKKTMNFNELILVGCLISKQIFNRYLSDCVSAKRQYSEKETYG